MYSDTELFLDKFPEPKTQKDLEKLFDLHPSLDSFYIATAAITERRKQFENLWIAHRNLANRKFRSQARKDFHACAWEMHLAFHLKKQRFALKSLEHGPDFILEEQSIPIAIEAVTSKHGEGNFAVPRLVPGIVQSVPTVEILLRITNSFDVKSKTFVQYVIDGVISSNTAKIIAINAGIFQYPPGPIPTILQACFSLGDLALEIPLGGGEPNSFYRHRPYIKKGTEMVETNLFLTPTHKNISAVIFSSIDVLNAQEMSGNDLVVVHNPNAASPISLEVFSAYTQYVWRESRVITIRPNSDENRVFG